MRKLYILFILTIFSFPHVYGQTGKVGIGTTSPHPSALLDLSSSDKGLLVPRLSTAQRTAISAPATGLLVYDTDQNQFYYHNGTSWVQAIGPQGPTGPTGPLVPGSIRQTLYHDGSGWTAASNLLNDGTNVIFPNGTNVGIGTNATSQKLNVKGNIYLENDDAWIGAGSTIERIEFDQSLDRIDMEDADVTMDNGRWIGIDNSNPRITFDGGSGRLHLDDANVTVDDGKWIGRGSTIERIEFDGANDEINLLGARIGVGTTAPSASAVMDIRSTD